MKSLQDVCSHAKKNPRFFERCKFWQIKRSGFQTRKLIQAWNFYCVQNENVTKLAESRRKRWRICVLVFCFCFFLHQSQNLCQIFTSWCHFDQFFYPWTFADLKWIGRNHEIRSVLFLFNLELRWQNLSRFLWRFKRKSELFKWIWIFSSFFFVIVY